MTYNRTKYGKFMYKLLYKPCVWLGRHKVLYYILNLTWGILLSLVGFIITLALLICGKKPHKYYGIYFFTVGRFWGGFETGLMFVRDRLSSEEVSMHELGHTYQNAILGPFQIFLVTIPSVIRYWYQEFRSRKGKDNRPYDEIWFEGNATDVGKEIVRQKEENKK